MKIPNETYRIKGRGRLILVAFVRVVQLRITYFVSDNKIRNAK
jgi:hypothetical protein